MIGGHTPGKNSSFAVECVWSEMPFSLNDSLNPCATPVDWLMICPSPVDKTHLLLSQNDLLCGGGGGCIF